MSAEIFARDTNDRETIQCMTKCVSYIDETQNWILAPMVRIFVDLTTPAEFDIALYTLSSGQVDKICNTLLQMPYSKDDALFGSLRERNVQGYNVIFDLTRQSDAVHVTIIGVRPPEPISRSTKFWRAVELIGKLRGRRACDRMKHKNGMTPSTRMA